MRGVLEAAEWERAVAVGAVRPRGVRLWLRSPGGGPHRIALIREDSGMGPIESHFTVPVRPEADHTWAFDYPEDVEGAKPLEPSSRYRFYVSCARDGSVLVGEGRFETFPDGPGATPSRVCVGVASCHQPFDEEGRPHPAAIRMMRAARAAWTRCGVKFALWVGDQFYSDYPQGKSLFDPAIFAAYAPDGRPDLFSCSGEEVRTVYQRRYREFWSFPEWRALQAEFPGYPMLDDHEAADNYGTHKEHHEPKWAPIRAGAGAAWRDYQFSRVADAPADHDGPYDFDFDYGAVSVYGLDVRSMRRFTGEVVRVFHDDQVARFSAWLNARVDAAALFIVSSVPFFFMPGWAAWVARHVPSQFREDAHDRWAHPDFHADRVRVLELIRAHQIRNPRQRVTLVCGDVHVGYVTCCDWRVEPKVELFQFVSSPITHEQETGDWILERHIPRTHFMLGGIGDRVARVHMMGSRFSRLKQPIGGLNVGVIEIDTSKEPAGLEFKLYGASDENPGSPELLFHVGTST